MTKPSDFSPAEALEVSTSSDAKQSRGTRWMLRIVGAGVLLVGWLAVSLQDIGQIAFVVDTIVFLAMALYAFTAAAALRSDAVKEERRLRLRLLVHNMELESISMRDELTQLFNRRYLFERLEQELHTAEGSQRPLAFIAIELKPVNHVNRTYGYAVGDQLLVAFGQLLMDTTRATDIPARMTGNKFGVILPDTSKRDAYTMIERLVRSIAATPLMEDAGLEPAIVASFGVSGYPWGSDTIDAIVQQAESAIAAQPGPDNEQGPAMDIPKVSRHAGQNVFKPKAHQT
jgi:diguanylate cyclase (GGDEF)-like protein